MTRFWLIRARSVVSGAMLWAALFVPSLTAQPRFPMAEADNLARIQNQVRESLEQLPNHTCRVEVSRAHLAGKVRAKIQHQVARDAEERRERIVAKTDQQAAKRKRGGLEPATLEEQYRAIEDDEEEIIDVDLPLDITDTVSLEVAVVQGRELYSFPGSPRFESIPLAALIGHGTVDTGVFAGHAQKIVVDGVGEIDYVREESLDGRPVRRYRYAVPLNNSRYSVTNKGQTTKVPYHGSFWASVDGDELLRLTVRVDEMPRNIGVDGFATQIDYQTVAIGNRRLLLPQRSRFTMLLSTGVESVNQTRFADCKSFTGSSTLSFDDSTARFYVDKIEIIENVQIPAGVVLPVRLETPIDSKTARVGTRVEAILMENVPYGADALLPAGAVLSGRLRRLEYYGGADSYYAVGIEFQELMFGSHRAVVALSLERVANNVVGAGRAQPVTWTGGSTFKRPPIQGVFKDMRDKETGRPDITENTADRFVGHELFGVGVVYVQLNNTDLLRLAPGLQMAWRTVSAPDESSKSAQ